MEYINIYFDFLDTYLFTIYMTCIALIAVHGGLIFFLDKAKDYRFLCIHVIVICTSIYASERSPGLSMSYSFVYVAIPYSLYVMKTCYKMLFFRFFKKDAEWF